MAVPTEMTRRLPLEHADLRHNSLADLSLEELIAAKVQRVEKVGVGQ